MRAALLVAFALAVAGQPGCSWQCDSPQCEAVCTPLCEAPACGIVCPDNTPCSSEPACSTSCNATYTDECPLCETHCEASPCDGCHIECPPLSCGWSCQKPTSCPQPTCELQCDAPSCGYTGVVPPPPPPLALGCHPQCLTGSTTCYAVCQPANVSVYEGSTRTTLSAASCALRAPADQCQNRRPVAAVSGCVAVGGDPLVNYTFLAEPLSCAWACDPAEGSASCEASPCSATPGDLLTGVKLARAPPPNPPPGAPACAPASPQSAGGIGGAMVGVLVGAVWVGALLTGWLVSRYCATAPKIGASFRPRGAWLRPDKV